MRLLFALLVSTLLGCSGGPRVATAIQPLEASQRGREPPIAQQVLPQPDRLPRAAIRYEALDGARFPYPLVRATLRGHDTWLIIDTGASHIVLAQWLVEAVGLPLGPSGQRGEGHAGEEIDTFVVADPQLSIESWGVVGLDELLVIDLPEVFAKLGLGGVLSPQALAPPGHTIVMDMPAREMRMVPEEWSLDDDRGDELVAGGGAVCPVDGRSQGAVYVVEAMVADRPARLVVDTGAAQTDVMMASAPARALLHRSLRGPASYTAGGKIDSRRVPNTAVTIGEIDATIELGIMPGEQNGTCSRDGHLGLDILERCVMLLSPERFDARCTP